ncbi:hypothetical protein DH2020_037353 [Rehmannia glutinosa]|uniref:Protein Lines N-terminal domain-containing protein n=1 Tax=Rehmannia glutinosa TaxID=99300 RepID=A0ABR0V378_REHGL
MMLRPRFHHQSKAASAGATAPSQPSGATTTQTSTSQAAANSMVPVYDFYSGLPKKPSPFLQQTVARFEKYLSECRHIHQYIESMRTAYLADQRRRGDENDPLVSLRYRFQELQQDQEQALGLNHINFLILLLVSKTSSHLPSAAYNFVSKIESSLVKYIDMTTVHIKQIGGNQGVVIQRTEFSSSSCWFFPPELLVESVDDGECSVSSPSHLDDRHCLANIIGDLMFLLAVNSRYAQHLAGNTLVAISEFLLTSLKLKSANWSVVAAIFQVLRNIQKYLKQDFDYKIMKAYIDSVSSLILNLPWDILREIYAGHNTEALQGSAKDVLVQTEAVKSEEITVFFGNFIQFLCSLVTQSSCLDDGVAFTPVISKIINLVPKLTAWCHTELQSLHHVRISHYFRHKVLMLMIKLSSSSHVDQTIHVTWIHLVRKYFEDLLLQPISGGKFDEDDFLEGSPFCTSIFDPGKQNMLSRHLQRLTVFLFLKCSLNLVSMKGSPDEPQRAYENLKHNCTNDLNLDSECRSESLGLIKLHEWLQAHVPADILVNDELYFDRCVRFTLSFLQLFMHEDDILFEMLLQLFRVPFHPDRRFIKDEPLAEVENHITFLASDLFNPIHLFHLFLAEIHYDHQVLLDYLISKDTGSSCAEYLLRSLRIVCNSWSLFVEFPGVEEGLGQLSPKRQKVMEDCTAFKGVLSPTSLKDGGRNYRQPFVAARDCLVSLKTSINSLNQKNLFPYNPQVLLRR